jgi:NRPS condensation-like uncharacterized protein
MHSPFNLHFTGGATLCICFHHAVCDAVGVGIVISTWSQIALGTWKDTQPFRLVIDRSHLIDRVQRDVESFLHPEYTVVPAANARPQFASIDPRMLLFESKYFRISLGALELLRSNIVKSLSIPFLINDVIVSAFWSCVTESRHRAGLMPEGTMTSMMGMAVDTRNRLDPPMPNLYTGNVNFYCPVILPLSDLISPGFDLGTVTTAVRSAFKFVSSVEHIADVQVGLKFFLGP